MNVDGAELSQGTPHAIHHATVWDQMNLVARESGARLSP